MATGREERLARNEAVFRAANERIARWEESHAEDGPEPYFCECANPECRERVSLRRSEYKRVRSHPHHFLVVPGHETPEVETVIETHDGCTVIEKDPHVSHVVEPSP